eukprot:UN05011
MAMRNQLGSFSSYRGKRGGTIGVYNDGDFTAEQIAEFREVFNWFDKNNDEFINEIELGNAMRALGENPTQQELTDILQSIHSTKSSSYSPFNSRLGRVQTRDSPTNSFISNNVMNVSELKIAEHVEEDPPELLYRVAQYKIDFSQFLIMMAHKMQNPDDEKEIRDAFKLFDTNNDGKIEKDKLMKAMITVGEPLTKREVTALFQQISDKNENTIDYEDFMSFMLNDGT